MNPSLVARVVAVLDRCRADYALIGAGALAVHGVARSTFDLDLLTTNPAVLDSALWAELAADGSIQVDVRRGHADDPLAGVVRVQAAGERDVDLVVGRWSWQAGAVERAGPVLIGDIRLPVVAPADLILLKLYAGGSLDRWDIEQLLAASDRQPLVQQVEAGLGSLPPDARRVWASIVGEA
jgi:hypothetical protein